MDGFTGDSSWETHSGSSPYLDAADDSDPGGQSGSWIYEDKTAGATAQWFNFANTAATGSDIVVNVSLRGLGDGGDYIQIYTDWTGSGGGALNGTVTPDASYSYKTIELGIHTATEINNLRIYLVYQSSGKGNEMWVDHMRIGLYRVGGSNHFDRPVTQGLSVASSTTRGYDGSRAGTQGISISNDAVRYVAFPRVPTVSLTFALDAIRGVTGSRSLTQGLTVSNDAAREYVGTRQLTQSLSLATNSIRAVDAARALSQSIGLAVDSVRSQSLLRNASRTVSFLVDATATLGGAAQELLRQVTASLSLSVDSVRGYQGERAAIQGLTLGVDSTRLIEVVRAASQGLTFTVDSVRSYSGARAAIQSLSLSVDATRIQGFMRQVSQGVSFVVDGARSMDVGRVASQTVSFLVDAVIDFSGGAQEFIRQVSMGISLSVDSIRRMDLHRSVTQSISLIVQNPNGVLNLVIKVVDSASTAVSEATVNLWDSLGNYVGVWQTNSTGYADIGGIAADNYTIQTAKENYQTNMNVYEFTETQVITITLSTLAKGGLLFIMVLILGLVAWTKR